MIVYKNEITSAYCCGYPVKRIVACGETVWEKQEPTPPTDYSKQYFTIEMLENGTISFKDGCAQELYYSIDDGQTWNTLEILQDLQVNQGDKIFWKQDSYSGSCEGIEKGIANFVCDSNFIVYGNIMSLLDGDNFEESYIIRGNAPFVGLFDSCGGLISAENLILPATSLTRYCYAQMFSHCTNLTKAPQLPATTLANYCYGAMFWNCQSLTAAPELPATALTSHCYESMFLDCTSLSYIKCLATDISATDCTNGWVNGVAANGTFVKDSSMTGWTTGNNGIPSGWSVI